MKFYLFIAFSLPLFFASCATYTTPGGPANLSKISDPSIAGSFKAKPAAKFPARIAVVRVQQSGYRSHTSTGRGSGAFSIVSTSEIEKEEDFRKLQNLPRVAGVTKLNSLLLPRNLQSAKDIRVAAAKLHTDLVLLYTLDTKFRSNDLFKPLSVITLGLSPTQSYRVTSSAFAILMDTRTGYLYGAVEEQSADSGLATGWGKSDAMDRTRLNTERKALDKLISSFEKLWSRVKR